jgi:glycosyltransferase involved in cell wall biosynthesis
VTGSGPKRIRVSAYTGGISVPSARLRVRQYIPALADHALDVNEYTLWMGKMMPKNWVLRPLWAALTITQRSATVPCSYTTDVTLISRHVLPAFIPYDRLLKRPRVLDVDDAIWLNRGGHRAGGLANACDAVICGNSFLADYFSRWNKQISIVPTAVNTTALKPVVRNANAPPVIGWTGTSDNFPYLQKIEKALAAVLDRHPNATLCIIADRQPEFSILDAARVRFVKWTEENERETLRTFTVGIMPLEDSLWARGKCSFKMLTYMATAIPVVVSPVGMNTEVLSRGSLGVGASSLDDWVDGLDMLLRDHDLGSRMGAAGREVAVREFSIEALAPRLARELRAAAGVSS